MKSSSIQLQTTTWMINTELKEHFCQPVNKNWALSVFVKVEYVGELFYWIQLDFTGGCWVCICVVEILTNNSTNQPVWDSQRLCFNPHIMYLLLMVIQSLPHVLEICAFFHELINIYRLETSSQCVASRQCLVKSY